MMKNNYKVLIISCWSLLLVCCLIKLLGADLFLAGTDNERFIALCSFIDNSFIKYIIYYVMNVFSCSIYYMAILKEKKINYKWFIPLGIYSLLKIMFNQFNVLFTILDLFMMIGLPLLINLKRWKYIILGSVLTILFQSISLILKLDNFTMFDENTLIGMILSIDYYIMLILYWLYSIKQKRGDER